LCFRIQFFNLRKRRLNVFNSSVITGGIDLNKALKSYLSEAFSPFPETLFYPIFKIIILKINSSGWY